MNTLNNLDIIVLAIMGIGVGVGLWKGLAKQFFYLIGIILGYIVAVKLYAQVASLFSQNDSSISKAISFIGIFFCCIILTSMAGYFLEKVLKLGGLTWLNRLGGGFLGFMKGMFVVVIITTVLIAFLPSDSPVLIKSSMLPYVISVTQRINRAIPEEIKEKFNDKIEDVKRYWIGKQIEKQIENSGEIIEKERKSNE